MQPLLVPHFKLETGLDKHLLSTVQLPPHDFCSLNWLVGFLTVPTEKKTICSFELSQGKADLFKEAVASTYWFEFFIGMLLHSETDSDTTLVFHCFWLALWLSSWMCSVFVVFLSKDSDLASYGAVVFQFSLVLQQALFLKGTTLNPSNVVDITASWVSKMQVQVFCMGSDFLFHTYRFLTIAGLVFCVGTYGTIGLRIFRWSATVGYVFPGQRAWLHYIDDFDSASFPLHSFLFLHFSTSSCKHVCFTLFLIHFLSMIVDIRYVEWPKAGNPNELRACENVYDLQDLLESIIQRRMMKTQDI